MSKLQQKSHPDTTDTNLAALSRFSSKVVKELIVSAKEDESVVVSPLSIALALRWLAEGCNNETRQEVLKAIYADESVNTLTNFVENAKGNENIILKIANKLYVRQDDCHVLDENFLAISRDTFQAEIETVNFAESQDTAKIINSWVGTQTNGKIKGIVSSSDLADPNLHSILVNAIYFLAKWESPFDVVKTKPATFYVTKSQTLRLSTMKGTKELRYHEDESLGVKMIEMPYIGGRASFVVILPNELEGLAAVSEKLASNDQLQRALADLHVADIVPVYIELPTLITKTDIDLKNLLPKIGVSNIFTGGLTGVLAQNEDLFVSRAIQKVYILVNEHQTEAVAATGINMYLLSRTYPNLNVKQFKADHPFLYVLVCDGVVLFAGGFSGSEEETRLKRVRNSASEEESRPKRVQCLESEKGTGGLL